MSNELKVNWRDLITRSNLETMILCSLGDLKDPRHNDMRDDYINGWYAIMKDPISQKEKFTKIIDILRAFRSVPIYISGNRHDLYKVISAACDDFNKEFSHVDVARIEEKFDKLAERLTMMEKMIAGCFDKINYMAEPVDEWIKKRETEEKIGNVGVMNITLNVGQDGKIVDARTTDGKQLKFVDGVLKVCDDETRKREAV